MYPLCLLSSVDATIRLDVKCSVVFAQMAGVCEGVCEVEVLELQYYEAQLELYDCKLEILKNEELLLLAQIHTIRRQIRGNTHTQTDTYYITT